MLPLNSDFFVAFILTQFFNISDFRLKNHRIGLSRDQRELNVMVSRGQELKETIPMK